MVALTILDTGLRISECLSLTHGDVNFDTCTLRIQGKGGKERLVPFSMELRKALFKYVKRSSNQLGGYVFQTRSGTNLTVRNFQRNFKALGKNVGITAFA
jgi:integrase/recombinase XerD